MESARKLFAKIGQNRNKFHNDRDRLSHRGVITKRLKSVGPVPTDAVATAL